MKKFLKGLMTFVLVFTLAFALTGCGDKENTGNSNNSGSTGGNGQQAQSDSSNVAWPSNEYTNLIPKPEGVTIYDEQAIDNNYFVGHNITLIDWPIEECKAYAEKLKDAGFTIPSAGYDSVVVKDTDTMYSFGAKNSDGVYVTVGSGNGTGTISIQVTRSE